MASHEPFVDIHCHVLPGLDDGAKSWTETVAMSRMAVADGTSTIIATPHQLGLFAHNDGDSIRARTRELQKMLEEKDAGLQVLPGADVRIEADLVTKLRRKEVVTLGDRGKHVLLELPHELYFPLDKLLDQLEAYGVVGVLSHPERNQGLLRNPSLVEPLVEHGCLMQITADSLTGAFGRTCQKMAVWLLEEDLVHFVATDAHGAKARRPLMQQAFYCVTQLISKERATAVCCHNPAAVAIGRDVELIPRRPRSRRRTWWLPWRRAG